LFESRTVAVVGVVLVNSMSEDYHRPRPVHGRYRAASSCGDYQSRMLLPCLEWEWEGCSEQRTVWLWPSKYVLQTTN